MNQTQYKIVIAGLISLSLHAALLRLPKAIRIVPAKNEKLLNITLKAPTTLATGLIVNEEGPRPEFTPISNIEMPMAWQAGSEIPATLAFSPKLIFPTFDDSALPTQDKETPARIVYSPELNFTAIEKAINVEIEVLIDETGLVKSAEIIRSNLSDAENDVIRKEMARFLFYPAITNDKAIESKKRFEFIRDAL